MLRRICYLINLPKIDLIILFVILLFATSGVNGASIHIQESGQNPGIIDAGSNHIIDSSVGEVGLGSQNLDTPDAPDLNQRINELEIQLEDAQTAIANLKRSNNELKLTVNDNKKRIEELFLIAENLKKLIEYCLPPNNTNLLDEEMRQDAKELLKKIVTLLNQHTEAVTDQISTIPSQ